MELCSLFARLERSASGCMVLVFILVFACAGAIPETVHLVQTNRDGYVVHLDVTFDMDERTVHAVVGDVSQYEGSVQTVNFHDYNTSYGVLKIINEKTCLLARTMIPMATPEKYSEKYTTEVHEHSLRFAPDKLTQTDVEVIAGPRIAAFCKDYDTFYTIATPIEKENDALAKVAGANRRRRAPAAEYQKRGWCVFTECFY